MPAAVLVVAYGVFGLTGMPLAVIVIMAALPTGSNALIFAQRYDTQQAQATAAIVVTTVGFVLSASVWLVVLALWTRRFGGPAAATACLVSGGATYVGAGAALARRPR